jgi:tRNA pseudouridine38-40 synthase
MPHWKLILTYDGTPYNGWQVQPNLPTVQGTLAEAIHRITGEAVLPQGSGRTDAGVHALAQVASFSLTVPIPAANLHRALNRALPASIRVLSVEAVPADFHARHSALRKTYEYRILPCGLSGDHDARICSPMLAPYVWPCRLPLDLAILQQAASHILGTHDFTSFAANDPDLTTRGKSPEEESAALTRSSLPNLKSVISTEAEDSFTVRSEVERPPHFADATTSLSTPYSLLPTPCFTRTIHRSAWRQQDDLLLYRITGSGFLHHMVRNLVGTFVEAAANRISADEIPIILAARNRSAAGPTAPASGLFLVEVEYE